MSAADTLLDAVCSITPVARDADGPVFREPWEAEAFAIAVALNEAGLFTWREWAEALSRAIRRAQAAGDPDLGDSYYHHWLAALEQLVAEKGVAAPEALAERCAAWDRAARATPHGQPILLENDPLAPA
ncbi:nitrile hydratase accessory protein [Chelatococcus daeguensis]|uniref:nitrile hydratase accessory protein n=1 Tax=Chelatococcus daeguensis TaxID=444444 RepID=UPI0007ABDE26|nr:nitrile hydratase accessory protein [Chelatococcus daeguensis]KZE36037.1 nitrile hydratase [Chelatococcus daeguensis]MBM3084177.1 nitrile hydratase accessory protein [Chelatococcus daeguensis]